MFHLCDTWADRALQGLAPSREEGIRLLDDPELPLLPLLHAAFRVRQRHFGRTVRVHILDNLENGFCSEDCHYCVQAAGNQAAPSRFRLKSDQEILDKARASFEAGAYRHCMVLSGRGPDLERIRHLAGLVRRIKAQWPIRLCLSAGFLDARMADILREAGLDRYNHNLNTAESFYGAICTTHDYRDRLATLESARAVGLEVCSGIIVGMGESSGEVVEVAATLHRLSARSIPVNFYVPVPGNRLGEVHALTPERCLRTLALFRFFNPDAEIRAAGGREVNLGALEALALFPANSLFAEGYLNTPGHALDKTLRMIRDAGFIPEQEP